jgi:hypothetical protein
MLLQCLLRAVENRSMDIARPETDPAVPEHFLAAICGILALALGAAVWSAMAAVFGAWSLLAAPGLGWMVAWACRYGGRRADPFVLATAWLLSLAGVLLALFAFSAFSVTQTSPDSGFQLRAVGLECLRLFTEPPWFGSAAVLLALAGARRALRYRRSRRADSQPAAARPLREPKPAAAGARPGAPRAIADGTGSRAA